jgi:hypothetical protein
MCSREKDNDLRLQVGVGEDMMAELFGEGSSSGFADCG